MVRGLYTAWTGMINEQKRLDVVSNNLANSDTTGYKKMGVTSQSFDQQLAIKINDASSVYSRQAIGDVSLGVKIGETYNDFSQGSFRSTENAYDFALNGNGFFTISTTDKSGTEHIRYTRDGAFTVTKEGYLVTKDGDFVLGKDGNRIQIPGAQTADVAVDELGNIYADGNQVAQFNLVDFQDYDYLTVYGENMFEPVEGAVMTEASCKVNQGYLEMSNVNVINEMVSMITITRAYETNQKLIQTQDSVLDVAVNQIGKV